MPGEANLDIAELLADSVLYAAARLNKVPPLDVLWKRMLTDSSQFRYARLLPGVWKTRGQSKKPDSR